MLIELSIDSFSQKSFRRKLMSSKYLKAVAINELNEAKTLAHLLKLDSFLTNCNCGELTYHSIKEILKPEFKFNRKIVKSYLINPNKIYDLTPRAFEYFVGELYNGLGYKVTVTQGTRDEGVDLKMEKSIDGMLHTYVVQCKHTTQVNKKLGVSYFRDLFGVVIDKGVTAGIMVTNRLLSGPAVSFVKKHASRLFSVCSKGLFELVRLYVQATA